MMTRRIPPDVDQLLPLEPLEKELPEQNPLRITVVGNLEDGAAPVVELQHLLFTAIRRLPTANNLLANKLRMQTGIDPSSRQKGIMAATFHDFSVIQHQD